MKPRLFFIRRNSLPGLGLGLLGVLRVCTCTCTCTRSTDDPIKGVSPRRSERKADGRIDPYYIGGD